MDSEKMEYSYNEEKEYVYLNVNGSSYPMLKDEYDAYLSEGLKNPVLIGDKIYMVNNKDFKVLKKIEKKLNSQS